MNRSKILAAVLTAALIAGGAAWALEPPPPDHVQSFTAAVERGYIEGDPAYYYNGEATPQEYAHAVMVALIYFEDNVINQGPTPSTTTTTQANTTTSTTVTTTTVPATTTTGSTPATTSSTTVPPTTTSTTTLPTGSETLQIGASDSGTVFDGLTIANPDGPCIEIYEADDVTIQNSTIGPCGEWPDVNAKGIYALDSSNINILNNEFVGEMRNAVQFDKVQGGSVVGNVGSWPLGESFAEDLVNMYMSNGTEAAPILITNNSFVGGGPSNSGTCIILGDGGGSWQTVEGNTCINPGQVGIGVASGEHMIVRSNYIRSDVFPWSNVGIYVWNQYPSPCSDVLVSGNDVEWYNSAGARNDFWNGGGC